MSSFSPINPLHSLGTLKIRTIGLLFEKPSRILWVRSYRSAYCRIIIREAFSFFLVPISPPVHFEGPSLAVQQQSTRTEAQFRSDNGAQSSIHNPPRRSRRSSSWKTVTNLSLKQLWRVPLQPRAKFQTFYGEPMKFSQHKSI